MAVTPYNEASVVAHCEELPPSPEREVITVSFSAHLEVFWRLPIVSFSKLFLVRDVATSGQELPDFADRLALDRQRPIEISRHWKCRVRTFATEVWAQNLSSEAIIVTRDGFRDQPLPLWHALEI